MYTYTPCAVHMPHIATGAVCITWLCAVLCAFVYVDHLSACYLYIKCILQMYSYVCSV